MIKFREPVSTSECYDRLDVLKQDMKHIELQISTPDRSHPDGTRLSSVEYWVWRKKAITALKYFQSEIVFLNSWKRKKLQETKKKVMPGTPGGTLLQMHRLMTRWVKEYDIVLSEGEGLLLQQARTLTDEMRG